MIRDPAFRGDRCEATLMHVADTLALCRGVKEVTVFSEDNCEKYHALAQQYLKETPYRNSGAAIDGWLQCLVGYYGFYG